MVCDVGFLVRCEVGSDFIDEARDLGELMNGDLGCKVVDGSICQGIKLMGVRRWQGDAVIKVRIGPRCLPRLGLLVSG